MAEDAVVVDADGEYHRGAHLHPLGYHRPGGRRGVGGHHALLDRSLAVRCTPPLPLAPTPADHGPLPLPLSLLPLCCLTGACFGACRFESQEEAVVSLPSYGSLFGAWLGCCTHPLDWEMPWQPWPIAAGLGACWGAAVGSALAALAVLWWPMPACAAEIRYEDRRVR